MLLFPLHHRVLALFVKAFFYPPAWLQALRCKKGGVDIAIYPPYCRGAGSGQGSGAGRGQRGRWNPMLIHNLTGEARQPGRTARAARENRGPREARRSLWLAVAEAHRGRAGTKEEAPQALPCTTSLVEVKARGNPDHYPTGYTGIGSKFRRMERRYGRGHHLSMTAWHRVTPEASPSNYREHPRRLISFP